MKLLDPRLRQHLRPARLPLAGLVAGSVVGGVLLIFSAFAIARLVSAVFDGSATGNWDAATQAALVLGIVTAARALAGWSVDACAGRASQLVTITLRRRLLSAAMALGAAALSRRRSGEVALLATRGVAAVDPYLTRYLPALVLAGVLPALTVLAIATQDLLSAGIVLATLPLVPFFAILIGLATRDRAERQWKVMAALSGHFVDVMRGLPTLVSYRRAEAQSTSIRSVTDHYRRVTQHTLRLAFASSAVLELVATLSVAMVAVTVGLRLADGSLDLRTALVVLLLAPEAYWPLRRVGAEFHAAAEGTATFEAADELLKAVPTASANTRPVPSPLHQGIGIDAITAAYPNRSQPVIETLSGFVRPRGLTAITGPSGAGKSTLLAVLMGALPLTAGSITLDGAPLKAFDLRTWQEQISWIPQRPWILTGTIADNVRLARPEASDREIWAALDRVALADVVATLPGGLEEPVGEDGTTLSAGERSRLALARAVVAERQWVFLDEPTAHLDALTEQVITSTLRWLARRSAVVVVAHRQSVVELADHIVCVPTRRAPAPAGRATEVAVPSAVGAPGASTLVVTDPVPAPPEGSPMRLRMGPRMALRTGALLGALASASGVALTATAGWLIARAAEHPPVLMLMVAIVGVRLFGLSRPALRYAERLVSHDVALRLLAERRVAVYDALVPLVPGRLGKQRGDVLASIVDDVDALVDEFLRVRAPLVTFALVSGLAVAFATWVLPTAGLVIALVLLIGAVASFLVPRLIVSRAEKVFVGQRAQLSAQVVATLQGAPDLGMWQASDRALREIDATGHRIGAAGSASARAVGAGRALAVLSAGAGMIAIAWLARSGLESGAVSKPMLALLVLLPLALLEVVTPLADAGALHVRVTSAHDRLGELSRTEPAVLDPVAPLRLHPGEVRLQLNEVSAGWGADASLHNVTLDLRPGSRIGVVGPSGCGKSTLAGVLLRFLDPVRGSYTIGAQEARALQLDDIRRTVGLVDDDPHVFGSTLLENVRLAKPDATCAEVAAALRSAQLGTWLQGLPRGMDTMLGDGYAHVSGGERARIALARAILSDPPMLVLDEPTAHLDTATARAVTNDLLAAGGCRGIVWITHGTVGLDQMDTVLDLAESQKTNHKPQAVPALTPRSLPG